MAKNITNGATNGASTIGATITLPEGFKVEAQGQEYTIGADTPIATIVYLLTNGFSQSLTDAGTSGAAKARNEAIASANESRGKGQEMTKEQEKAFAVSDLIRPLIEAASTDAVLKRMEALRAGTMVAGAKGPSGPRRSPFDAFAFGQAKLYLDARARQTGKPLPKGDALQGLLQTVMDQKRDEYRVLFDGQNGKDDGIIW